MHNVRPLIAIDLDGTLIEARHWPKLGPLKPGAVKYVKMLLRDNDVTIFTARINKMDLDGYRRDEQDVINEIIGIRALLDSNGLEDVDIHIEEGKPSALVFIDDRAVEFDGSWRRAYHKTRTKLGQA